MQRRHLPGRQGVLELTPLIDVAMTLVVFLLLGNEMAETFNIPILLPAVSSSAGAESGEQLCTVTVTQEETIYVDGVYCQLEDLGQAVAGRDAVSLQADQDLRYGFVTTVYDVLRQAGVGRILGAVRPAEVEEW